MCAEQEPADVDRGAFSVSQLRQPINATLKKRIILMKVDGITLSLATLDISISHYNRL